jgi:hypothetical protein
MSGGMGGFGVGGVGAMRTTFESELLWGADQARNAALWQSAQISGATRDAGNTPTTILRPGLIVGRLTSGGEFEEWDAAATDGTQNIAGILDTELRAQDYDGNNQDRHFRILVARGPVKARKLLIGGSAFIGHADEYLARKMLIAAGFVFDDDPFGYKAGSVQRVAAKASAYTVVADDNGTLFTNAGAAAKVVFTLPAIKRGLSFSFYSVDNDGINVTAATADTIITHNDTAADSIDVATTGRNIGAMLDVFANEDASRWLAAFRPWNIADDGSTVSKAVVNT